MRDVQECPSFEIGLLFLFVFANVEICKMDLDIRRKIVPIRLQLIPFLYLTSK